MKKEKIAMHYLERFMSYCLIGNNLLTFKNLHLPNVGF
jgi:hypothetical protein